MQSQLKILFVDDHVGLRDGMIFMLEKRNPHFKITGADDIDSAILKLNEDKEIRVVILDVNLDGENSISEIPRIRAANEEAAILVYTMYNDDFHVQAALLAGIQGFITKEANIEELEKAIVTVSQKNNYFNSAAGKVLNSLLPGNKNKNPVQDEKTYLFDNYKSLSKKEREVFIHIAEGLEIEEIARLLGKSEKTILNQRSCVYNKMFIRDRHDLIEKAKLLGLIF